MSNVRGLKPTTEQLVDDQATEMKAARLMEVDHLSVFYADNVAAVMVVGPNIRVTYFEFRVLAPFHRGWSLLNFAVAPFQKGTVVCPLRSGPP
jgi:hypothetical protein